MPELNLDDTISAISTPIGEAGIGIVRLSGKDALKIADKIFKSSDNKKPSSFKTYTIHYGWIVDEHRASSIEHRECGNKISKPEIIDEVILTIMRSPKTYTKEDIAEINCHSGIVPLKRILDLTLKNGARLAEPGEFTRRALINGRIDLIQAEAVLNIIQARTDKALAIGLNQLKGKLSQEIEAIRNFLLDIYAQIEATIDFPDEDIKEYNTSQLSNKIERIKIRIKKLLDSSSQGKILCNGIRVVIAGKPNVGKSSLLNILLRDSRAIVTDIPGTTRDTIEETANIKGIPVRLVDTAGIIEPRDLVEIEAVKKSHESINSADLVLLVLDASSKFNLEDNMIIQNLNGKKIICLVNKCDLNPNPNLRLIKKDLPKIKIIKISCLKNQGIAKLEEAICRDVWNGRVFAWDNVLVSNLRQIECLRNVFLSIEKVELATRNCCSIEIICEELKSALKYLDDILGKNISIDVLDTIFSKFCIGK
ncbi:MAG: tRNA uridine-5-carboxymethylaminomethyl(34) synthesis GTPase MnmE [Candidatus Omnitrophota bacterium]|nr:tRNA uridine-5-carboxymethylaminomethyl(34) synthesis GTPase MnmE [Candidatus Omnitrophota bacterium]